jgi:hypothetical protein
VVSLAVAPAWMLWAPRLRTVVLAALPNTT